MCLFCCNFILEYVISLFYVVFFFKQKTAYEMRISDWSSDVCSSDLDIADDRRCAPGAGAIAFRISVRSALEPWPCNQDVAGSGSASRAAEQPHQRVARSHAAGARAGVPPAARAIDLPRRDSSAPDQWSLPTPDRAIPVPAPTGPRPQERRDGKRG